MKAHVEQILLWTPRILSLLFILFISLFALDVFNENKGFADTLSALGLHLIPTAILVLVLLLSWKREWIGGVVFMFFALIYTSQTLRHPDWILVIAGPQFVISILFLVRWFRHRQQTRTQLNSLHKIFY